MKKLRFKLLLQHFRSESLSLRKRFLLYIVSAVATFLALAMVLLNLFGVMNSANVQIMHGWRTVRIALSRIVTSWLLVQYPFPIS